MSWVDIHRICGHFLGSLKSHFSLGDFEEGQFWKRVIDFNNGVNVSLLDLLSKVMRKSYCCESISIEYVVIFGDSLKSHFSLGDFEEGQLWKRVIDCNNGVNISLLDLLSKVVRKSYCCESYSSNIVVIFWDLWKATFPLAILKKGSCEKGLLISTMGLMFPF